MFFIDIFAAHVLPRMIRPVFTVLWIVKQKIKKKRLTLGMIGKATCSLIVSRKMLYCIVKAKKFLIHMLLIVLFVEKLYIVNVKLPEGNRMSGTALATATSLLCLAPLLRM